MATPNAHPPLIRFGDYELDLQSGMLRKNGMRIRCQEQPLQVLAALVENPGQLVTREDLRRRVWPRDTFVDFDHALNTAIKKIRAALNDDADAPRYIETVPRRGYRFISTLTPASASASAQAIEEARAGTGLAREISKPAFGEYQEDRFHPGILAVAGILVLAIAGGYYFTEHRARASVRASSGRVMVAVLPFENMTSDPKQEFFSDGMTEETITRLGRLNSKRIGVIARTSAMQYKNVTKSVKEIGRELHADYLVEGSVRREGNLVRVTAQLIHTADQSPEWTREFDFESPETLRVESDVAANIVSEVSTLFGEPTSSTHREFSEDAYDSRLRALAQTSIHTEQGLRLILANFEQATKDDANCAQPYSGLAHVYERGANLGFLPPNLAYAKAKEAAQKAIQLDPQLPETHVFMADALLTIDYDWKGAQAEIERALVLNSNDPMVHEWNSIFLGIQGKSQEALAEMSRAVELDPLNAERLATFGNLLFMAGRYKEAEANLVAAIQLDPASEQAHCLLQHLYEKEGRQAEAIAEMGTIFSLRGQSDAIPAFNGVYQKSGYAPAMQFAVRKNLEYLEGQSRSRYVSPLQFAAIYAHLGDKAQTLRWVEKAYDERDVGLPCLPKEIEQFGLIKEEPRFQAILQKVRFPG
jgi:TolB-like protein/DNA-binding winged helix-turn-helix (wHTH) protein/Flp pilus assembly protein TadD